MQAVYFVVLNNDIVEGPFETRKIATHRAAELTTNEVGLQYRVISKSPDSTQSATD